MHHEALLGTPQHPFSPPACQDSDPQEEATASDTPSDALPLEGARDRMSPAVRQSPLEEVPDFVDQNGGLDETLVATLGQGHVQVHEPTNGAPDGRHRPSTAPDDDGSVAPSAQAFIDDISRTVTEDPATHPTTPAPRTRTKQARAPPTLRRSRCIANTGPRGTALTRAQSVLMRKLGLTPQQDLMSQEDRDVYANLFEHPLSRSQVSALASLFGWTVPDDCEVRSAEFLQN